MGLIWCEEMMGLMLVGSKVDETNLCENCLRPRSSGYKARIRCSRRVTCDNSPKCDSYSWKYANNGLALDAVVGLPVSLPTVVSKTARASGDVSVDSHTFNLVELTCNIVDSNKVLDVFQCKYLIIGK